MLYQNICLIELRLYGGVTVFRLNRMMSNLCQKCSGVYGEMNTISYSDVMHTLNKEIYSYQKSWFIIPLCKKWTNYLLKTQDSNLLLNL